MLAAVLNAFDGPQAIVVTDVPDPSPGPQELLLRVDAAAIGPWDVASTTGAFVPIGGNNGFPQTLGWDLCGTVVTAGADTSGWTSGERVFGFTPQPWSASGVFAELAVLPAALLARVPEGLDAITAATLPVAALTAELAVREAQAGEGTRLLVIGAVGAVGGFVSQLASAAGAQVIAPVSAGDREQALALGASACVERDGDVAALTLATGGPVDAIVDLVGPPARALALAALRPGGRLVTSIPGELPELSGGSTARFVQVQPDPGTLRSLGERVVRGELRARVGEVRPLSAVREAFEIARTAGGAKTVLEP